MGLSEKLKQVVPTQSGLPCGMGKLLIGLNEEDRNELNKILFDSTNSEQRVSNTKIHQILVEEGYEIAPYSIAQHRRKQCRCFVGKYAHLRND